LERRAQAERKQGEEAEAASAKELQALQQYLERLELKDKEQLTQARNDTEDGLLAIQVHILPLPHFRP
jgi:hypothetical protein